MQTLYVGGIFPQMEVGASNLFFRVYSIASKSILNNRYMYKSEYNTYGFVITQCQQMSPELSLIFTYSRDNFLNKCSSI